MGKIQFNFNDKDYEYGITLTVNIEFIQRDDNTMECLNCTFSDGLNGVDYSDVIATTTILDVIKEFMRGED